MVTQNSRSTHASPATEPDTSTDKPDKPDHSTIAGLPVAVFAAGFVLVVVAALTDTLPPPMVTGFAVAMTLGGLLMWLGNLVPVLRDFGLSVMLCILVPAALAHGGLVPTSVVDTIATFTGDFGFIDFFVIAIVAGSILGMPRKLLLQAGPRLVVPLLGCITLTLFIVGGLGAITGFGFREGLFYVAAPTMAGGLGIGAVPMSDLYAGEFGGDPSGYMGMLMSAVVLANTVCILIAGIFNGVGKRKRLFVGFNGNGQLLRVRGNASELALPKSPARADFTAIGQGVLIACLLLVAGVLLNGLVPDVDELAWSILLAAVVKIFGLLPKRIEDAAASWNGLATSIWLPMLLVCVSLSYISIDDVLAALADPLFLALTVGSVVCSALLAGLLGWLAKLNFVEASITPGLAMADSGGSGDVAMLSAAERIHLMPFAQFATRIGGMVTLLLVTLLVPVF
ncbi:MULTISPECIES: 2-hydroxycarboxylate transporter family protein [Prauserella salsuginis group]|uniref:2-hydroxycarboxylate transporter family protein n=1 Tax=Prauserella salsuginis TaxID=387889 RepID=A0ABW6GBL7_9PSEU|nr:MULTISPECIES: 2-hydroxycarboxylate transporter family protein [Prauserella salsuginis group]MCR3721903.1 Na+/citrate or Na+/malate symporter [Prauserella flava]MCR3735908.1 Na+/citrate or Na+/malate symporter [Prauserella salsuginis]